MSRLCPGAGPSSRSQRKGRGDQRIPTISFDYGFATELTKQEDTHIDKREELNVSVVKDERTRTLFAHAVEQTGIDSEEHAVKQVAKDIEELGYRKVSVKCDQEPSTMAFLRLMRLVNVDVVDQVLHDHPAVGDSQSNGSIEIGVKTVMGQLRTMRAALERKLACKIPLDHPVMAWMTTHAAQLLSRFQVGHDGHTPHERLRGKPFKVALPEFGETVWRHHPVKNVHAGKNNIPGACTYDQRVLLVGRDKDGEGKESASDNDC